MIDFASVLKSCFSAIPAWIRKTFDKDTLFILVVLIVLMCTSLILFCSCGSTVKALVQSPKDSATTTITITTNNPTEVSPTVDPNVTYNSKSNIPND